MYHSTTRQGVLFEDLGHKPVHVQFDQSHSSSDGGALLLKACDKRLGLSDSMVAALSDPRQLGKVQHDLLELVRQRVFGMACGYADANDASRLAEDPIFKQLLDRDPIEGATLASQPTLSRFEQWPTAGELLRLGEALADTVIQRHRQRLSKVHRITLDLDPTEDPAHGGQQLTFFNRLYDHRCYLPLAGFMSFNDEPDHYLFSYLLRPGNVPAKQGCLALLKRLIPRLRAAFPDAVIRIRLDAGFSGAELYEFFEKETLEYVVCMAKNATLLRLVEPLMAPLRQAHEQGEPNQVVYGEDRYRARNWNKERRVVMRAQMLVHPGRVTKENPRFLITNIKGDPQVIYEAIYCARGDAENRIKELKEGLQIDRTSCTRFLSNQFRVLMTAAAYVLLQEVRLAGRGTTCARAQVSTLQLRLLKLGAWVESSVRRVVVHLPMTTPYAEEWRHIARSIGAVPT